MNNPQRPFTVNATIRTQPPGIIVGMFRMTVRPEGLHFQNKKQEFLIPVGTPAEYLKHTRLLIHLPDYRIELSVGLNGYAIRFAQDLAQFLIGRRAQPQPADYRMPAYFWVLTLLPLGIVAIARGGAIPGAVGGGLAAANYALLQKEEWPLAARIGATLALSAAGYAGLFALINAAGGLR